MSLTRREFIYAGASSLFALGLVGCGNSNTTSTSTSDTQKEEQRSQKRSSQKSMRLPLAHSHRLLITTGIQQQKSRLTSQTTLMRRLHL